MAEPPLFAAFIVRWVAPTSAPKKWLLTSGGHIVRRYLVTCVSYLRSPPPNAIESFEDKRRVELSWSQTRPSLEWTPGTRWKQFMTRSQIEAYIVFARIRHLSP